MGAAEIPIRWATGPDDLRGAIAVREQVFCVEQGVPRSEEIDGRDEDALHLVALAPDDGRVIGTLRLLLDGGDAKIGRVAVQREWRRRGIASRMLDIALADARERGCPRARLASQMDATGLYARAGFTVQSEPFYEARILHVWMGLELAPDRPGGAVTSLAQPPPPALGAVGFRDRYDAGLRLAALLERFRDERPVVVGIPRGGVPVAAEVARALGAPLDVAVVRKIGAPQNPEYAIGALAEGGVHVLSEHVVRAIGVSDAGLGALLERVQDELEQRTRRYRGAREPAEISGRTVILVDDGLATGRSARAAVRSLRKRGAARVVLAVPVAAPAAAHLLEEEADEVVCVETPRELWAVGQWYEDFAATPDEEVAALLAEGAARGSG
jgi:predicted phosphoribosyltransferase/predicted GNAT family N-acyltransferase